MQMAQRLPWTFLEMQGLMFPEVLRLTTLDFPYDILQCVCPSI